MPRKPLDHVSVGEILPTDIATWNPMIDAGRLARQKRPGGDSPAGTSITPALLVYVRNDTGASLDVFSVVKLGTPIISASIAPHEARRTPCFPGTTPSAATDPFAILIEPLASGSTGRAIVQGVAVCDIVVNDNAHGYCQPMASSATLDSDECGPAKIIWKAGSSGTQRAVVLLGLDPCGASGHINTGVTSSVPAYTSDLDEITPTPLFTTTSTLNGDPTATVALYTTTSPGASTPAILNYTVVDSDTVPTPQLSTSYYPSGTGQAVGTVPTTTPTLQYVVEPNEAVQLFTVANSGSPRTLLFTLTNPSSNVVEYTVGNPATTQGVIQQFTVDADGDIDSLTQTVAVDGSSTSFVHSYTLNGSVTQLALTGTLVLTGATVTATTQSAGNNSTLVATTAYVDAAVAAADCCPDWTVTTAQFDKTNTTLANVTGLSATLENSKTYYFEAILNVTADITGGSKYAIGGTATASAVSYTIIETSLISRANTIADRQTSLGGSASQSGATSQVARIVGTITTSAAGTLTVQFAQDSASGTSSVLVGSTFRVEEIA